MLSLWKSNLHIEPEIQENSNLIPLTRMILSIFFPNPASFQLAPCSNLCRYFLDGTLTSIFCFSHLLSLLASSLLPSLSLCLSGSQFNMCSAGHTLISFQPSTPPISAFWTILMLQNISHMRNSFLFHFFMLLPALACCLLLLPAAACSCACSLHLLGGGESRTLGQGPGARVYLSFYQLEDVLSSDMTL